MKVRGFISVLALLAGCIGAYAAPKEHSVSAKIGYPVGKTEVNQDYRGNGKAVSTLDNVLNSGAAVSRIEVTSSSSPEGPYSVNRRLAGERAFDVKGNGFSATDLVSYIGSVIRDGLR